jgi:predicted exporter
MSHRFTLLLAWLALLLLGGGWLFTTLKPQTDLSLFLPQGKSETQRRLLSELHHGKATRLLLFGIAGGDAEGRADLSQDLVAALRRSERFERVENGTPGDLRFDPQLLRYRYLLTPPQHLQETLSVAGLRTALEARLAELQSPLPNPFKSLVPRDPTSAYAKLLNEGQPQHRIARTAGVWSSQQGDLAILLAMAHEGGLALDQQAETVSVIRNSFDRLNPDSRYRLLLSGPGVFAVDSKQMIESESRQLSLLASGVILLLLLLAYRHPPYLLYAALPLVSALLAATLLTRLLFDNLHGITLAFGITLLGVTLDYPVHLFSHLTRGEAASHTMRSIWPTLRLGVLTTCLGYLVLVATDFTGLQQLGVFTLAGLLTAALVSRHLLPLLLQTVTPPSPRGDPLLRLISRKRWTPVALLGGATLLAIVALCTGPRLWNDDVAVLSPLPAELLAQDRFLRQQLMADESSQLMLLRGQTIEQLLVRCESLKLHLHQAVADDLSTGASLPCDYLPSRARQAQSRARIPPREEMALRLEQALEGLPFRAQAFDAFLDELQASRGLDPLTYTELQAKPLRERLDPLLRAEADGWLALAPLSQATGSIALATRLEQAQSGITYLNLREETSRLVGDFRRAILAQVFLGIAVMLAVLWFGLRSLAHALGILLPIAAAVLITLAVLQVMGESMNLFHLISLMLVVGIGVDFSLFFSRATAEERERNTTLHALSLCALSSVSVFAILGSSSIPVLHAIGLTVAFGVGLSYLATYAFWYMPWPPLRKPGRRTS